MSRSLLILLLALFCAATVQAQEEVFSPNAAELGKYGKVPVNYYNGLPNISIPLTQLEAKNYTLPVYLTYHAGGNKPEQHPGWVGQGWVLHAGGCINRIVHGGKDETTEAERIARAGGGYGYTDNPGNFYHAQQTQTINWLSRSVIEDEATNPFAYKDYEPDEFQVNLEDFNASFYFTGTDEVKIISQSDADFKASYVLGQKSFPLYEGVVNPDSYYYVEIRLYTYIKEIILTRSDGTVYTFGGDDDAIEFSAQCEWPGTSAPNGLWIGTANSWLLTSIKRPDGEEINFEYERNGIPVAFTDSHSAAYYGKEGDEMFWATFLGNNKENLHYTFLWPAYLKSISSKVSGESIGFQMSKSTELGYNINMSDLALRTGISLSKMQDTLTARNYYMKLDRIHTNKGDYTLSYTADTQTRLKLLSVALEDNGNREWQYSMEYNALSLPSYNSRKTDLWGYYGLSTAYNPTTYRGVSSAKSQINPVLEKAEMLFRISYPTGGYSEYDYESHDYSSIARQFPFEVGTGSGVAGGLRIKEIRDYAEEGKPEIRRFSYAQNGVSTGVLAGVPSFFEEGLHSVNIHTGEWMYGVYVHVDEEYDAPYFVYSEQTLNQLSTTFGNSVTYSVVTESRPGAGKTEYYYYNHEEANCLDLPPAAVAENIDNKVIINPFSSRELNRGLLKKRIDYKENGTLVREEENSYKQDTTEFVAALSRFTVFGALVRTSYYKHFCHYPRLLQKTVTEYSDNGNSPLIETTTYTYDAHRNVRSVSRSRDGVTEQQTTKYSGNLSAGIYTQMQAKNIISVPVERTMLRNGKVVEAELTTYKEATEGLFVPNASYRAALGDGLTTFPAYDGNTIGAHYGIPERVFESYDGYGNPLCILDRAGIPTSWKWDARGNKPVAVFIGAKSGFKQTYVPGMESCQENGTYSNTREIVKTFHSDAFGSFGFTLTSPSKMDLEVTLDGNSIAVHRTDPPTSLSGNPEGDYQYSTIPRNLASGDHSLSIKCSNIYITGGGLLSDDPSPGSTRAAMPTLYYPFSGGLTMSYIQAGVVLTNANSTDILYEDFEESGTAGSGFLSSKGRVGNYQQSVSVVPGKTYLLEWMQKSQGAGKWTAHKENVVSNNGSYTITITASAQTPIDNIRFRPADTTVESYMWTENNLLRARTDGRGITESFRYDALGRLVGVDDNDGNPEADYEYNYKSNN